MANLCYIYDIMKSSSGPLPPRLRRRAEALGERLKKARLRRRLPAELVATRARVSRSTLSRLENGDPRVSWATILRVLSIYGLDGDLDRLAADDELGRRLQDAELKVPKRARRRKRTSESGND